MKYTLLLLAVGFVLIIIPVNISQPSFNGTNPGCGGGGCHTFQDGIVSASATDLQVQITVSGTSGDVAGELVDGTGTVVAVNNGTSSNPFTLTAPGPGNYTVNAGHKSPLRWDSTTVNISTTGIGENHSNPTLYKLYDNYPNPFNPSTTLRYTIPDASFVSITIYNAVGNEVAVLVNEMKPAGTYETEFSSNSEFASGVYYYQLKSDNFVETKKMILLK